MKQKAFKLNVKQLLLASALGAALVPAFATNVTLTGLVDNYVGSVRMSGNADSKTVLDGGGMTTSWFGINGTEDLGGGLKANFALTSFIQTDTGAQGRAGLNDNLFSRDAHVGLTGNFGGLSFGRDLSPTFLPNILFNPFGDSFAFSPLIVQSYVPTFEGGAPVWGNSLAGETGWSNEVIYTTPNFGGLTANIHYQLGEVAGNTGKHSAGINALYFNGPLALTAYYNTVEVPSSILFNSIGAPNGAASQKAWMLGGSYDLTVAKLFATYGQTSHDIDLQDKTVSLGASVPAGPGKVLVAWAQTDRNGAAVGADQKRDTASVGYDYDLSKRTDLYANFMNDKVSGQSSGNSFGVGVRHRF